MPVVLDVDDDRRHLSTLPIALRQDGVHDELKRAQRVSLLADQQAGVLALHVDQRRVFGPAAGTADGRARLGVQLA